jgi:hypothetical protein
VLMKGRLWLCRRSAVGTFWKYTEFLQKRDERTFIWSTQRYTLTRCRSSRDRSSGSQVLLGADQITQFRSLPNRSRIKMVGLV